MEGQVGQGLFRQFDGEPYEAAAPERERPQVRLEGVSPHSKVKHRFPPFPDAVAPGLW